MKLTEQDERDWPLRLRAAYESDHGKIHVVEAMWACFDLPTLNYILLPSSWGNFMARSPSGLGRIGSGSLRVWRPLMYEWQHNGDLRRLGSQTELAWRFGTMLAGIALIAGDEGEKHFREYWEGAQKRAEMLLREHLTPQQLLDLEVRGHFFVRGEINKLYAIDPGNGFAICDHLTQEPTVSCCLHPEQWLPHDDVALATKLLLESGKSGEEEALSACRSYPVKGKQREATEDEFVAAALEIDMY